MGRVLALTSSFVQDFQLLALWTCIRVLSLTLGAARNLTSNTLTIGQNFSLFTFTYTINQRWRFMTLRANTKITFFTLQASRNGTLIKLKLKQLFSNETILWGIPTNPNITILAPTRTPLILYYPIFRRISNQKNSMIYCVWRRTSEYTWWVRLPIICWEDYHLWPIL